MRLPVGDMAENRGGVRVGIGFDAHPLREGRKLILGGVEIPFALGLEGHSDADVLVHAVIDAILGAAGQSDIGRHFPPGDPATLGISSLVLLEKVDEEVRRKGYRILQIDSVIIAEKPKLAPYVDSMRSRIARTVHLKAGDVNVKAKTTEGMGFTGKGEGVAAQAVVLLSAIRGSKAKDLDVGGTKDARPVDLWTPRRTGGARKPPAPGRENPLRPSRRRSDGSGNPGRGRTKRH